LKDDAMIRNSLIAASLFGLALTASQPAFAETSLVGYADLDLTTQAGNAKLDQRLKRAAKKVCGLSGTANPLREAAANQQCFAKAFAEARRAKVKVQQTMLAAR
jgi:UrcA family protein